MIRVSTILTFAAALFWWLPAVALQADQVRGEVVEVSPEDNQVSLRVIEAGDGRAEQPGDLETYELAADATIRRAPVGHETLDPVAVGEVAVADLALGDELVLSFEEIDGRQQARDVSVGESGPAQADTDVAPFEGRDRDAQLRRERTDTDWQRERTDTERQRPGTEWQRQHTDE
jgi:hypothetical protein